MRLLKYFYLFGTVMAFIAISYPTQSFAEANCPVQMKGVVANYLRDVAGSVTTHTVCKPNFCNLDSSGNPTYQVARVQSGSSGDWHHSHVWSFKESGLFDFTPHYGEDGITYVFPTTSDNILNDQFVITDTGSNYYNIHCPSGDNHGNVTGDFVTDWNQWSQTFNQGNSTTPPISQCNTLSNAGASKYSVPTQFDDEKAGLFCGETFNANGFIYCTYRSYYDYRINRSVPTVGEPCNPDSLILGVSPSLVDTTGEVITDPSSHDAVNDHFIELCQLHNIPLYGISTADGLSSEAPYNDQICPPQQ